MNHDHSEHDHGHGGHADHGHEAHDHHDHHDEHDHAGHSSDHAHEAASHDHHAPDEHEHKKKKIEPARKKIHNLSLVSSVGFTIDGLLDVTKFNEFMSGFLKEKAADLFRSKGVLAFKDQGDQKFVFQGVHDQIQFGPSERDWQEGEDRKSKLVFIGKNLDYEFLKRSVQSCCAEPEHAKVTMHKRA